MLELIFVIVVVAILAAVIVPRMDRDTIYEAAEQVLGHIKYTQHLAMVDNIYDDNTNNWHYARWQIDFYDGTGGCGEIFYAVGSDTNLTGVSLVANDAARDPLTNDLLYNDTATCARTSGWHNDIILSDKYSIASLSMSAACNTANDIIAFDQLGRPYTAFTTDDPTANLLKTDCNITITDSSANTATITITPETGYSFITFN